MHMAKGSVITTRAIEDVIDNSKKLSRFTLSPRKQLTEDDYISLIAYRAFTLVKLDDKHKQRFAKFIQLSETTTADFGYLCDLLANTPEFKKYDFKLNPILELYEDLLRENWATVQSERELLDSIDAFDKTPDSNVKISEAIQSFLKNHVLTASHNIPSSKSRNLGL
jgi:hypothetical protein